MALPDPTSRYAGVSTIDVVQPDGSVRRMGAPRVVPEPPVKGVYQSRAGDRLDLLARRATGDTTRWWVLADANQWADPTLIEQPGTTIDLPDA
jgi:nucleoid-associated protein YgaU